MAEGAYPLEEGVSKGCEDFIRHCQLLCVQWDRELHNGHLRSDWNLNHIGEKAGANPLYHATLICFRHIRYKSWMKQCQGVVRHRELSGPQLFGKMFGAFSWAMH